MLNHVNYKSTQNEEEEWVGGAFVLFYFAKEGPI